MGVAATSSAESHRERTGFEGNRHGVYDSADRRPDFLRQFDLGLIGVTGDHRQENDILDTNVLQGSEVALCDR